MVLSSLLRNSVVHLGIVMIPSLSRKHTVRGSSPICTVFQSCWRWFLEPEEDSKFPSPHTHKHSPKGEERAHLRYHLDTKVFCQSLKLELLLHGFFMHLTFCIYFLQCPACLSFFLLVYKIVQGRDFFQPLPLQ